ncbi:MAG: hypothetical protein RBS07_00780 [Lentimicrobium sp.]|jgi:hypothetical protein|nr:hypothetical protein [Lentimicrobium sp.]
MGIIRFLAIAIMVYLFFRVLSVFILPWLVKFWLKRFQARFYDQNPHLRKEQDSREGEITIKKVAKDDPVNIPDDFGDYIDYEDVNEEKK